MDAIQAMLTRRSRGQLDQPAPPPEVLEKAFACALRAPDHRMIRPWRYLVIQDEALAALGDIFATAALADKPDMEPAEIERMRKMPQRAPLIVVAITTHHDDAKVPRDEQVLSTGAAVQNFLVALHAQGYSAMWRTGPMAAHPRVMAALGLTVGESIAGFVYAGTGQAEPKAQVPLQQEMFVRQWRG
jgi:nitroreductase